MDSANEQVQDVLVGNAVDLSRFTASMSRDAMILLDDLAEEIRVQLARINPSEPQRKTFRQMRLEKLQKEVNKLVREYYGEIEKEINHDLKALAPISYEMAGLAINEAIAVDIASIVMTTQAVNTLVSNTLVEGATVHDWLKQQARQYGSRFQSEIAKGVMLGENLTELYKRFDGFFPTTKNNMRALVVTSAQAISNEARVLSYEDNDDLISGIKYLSTLDNRTTIICKSLDGLVWSMPDKEPVGHDKKFLNPPSHFNCRSTTTLILKSYEELNGLQQKKIEEAGTRASMDGQVPADQTYEQWLKKKPVKFQKEMLGEDRYRLWNDGKIGFTDLTDTSGNPLTIDELQGKVRKK